MANRKYSPSPRVFDMEISKSDIIISLAGRDKGKFFYVVGVEEGYVLLADGRGRKLKIQTKEAETCPQSLSD